MKLNFIILAALACATGAQAQVLTDTLQTHQLQDVVVKAVRATKDAPFAVTNISKQQLRNFSHTGRELPQNDAEAVRWYRRAAAQNHAMALYNLSNHYLSGRGVPQDTEEAIKWYRLAADRDVLPAMNNLGVIYASGRGVRRNEAEAIKWYRRAAERGDETAIRNLKKRGIKV